ncbi:hypothetical protein BKA60DRAFT_552080 [Fusarium oxysporum]|nr:hypothetical protein BKA60DRAFT_552080 [Fusarium oxysporum]
MRAVRYIILLATPSSCCFLYGAFYFKKPELALDKPCRIKAKAKPRNGEMGSYFPESTTTPTAVQIRYLHSHFTILRSRRAQM